MNVDFIKRLVVYSVILYLVIKLICIFNTLDEIFKEENILIRTEKMERHVEEQLLKQRSI